MSVLMFTLGQWDDAQESKCLKAGMMSEKSQLIQSLIALCSN